MGFRVFVSAVSGELGAARAEAARLLRRKQLDVSDQDHFRQGGGLLLEKLRDEIARCDAVVLLIGDYAGDWPAAEHAAALGHVEEFRRYAAATGASGASYTQWEFLLAKHFGKATFCFFAEPDFPRGRTRGADPPAPEDAEAASAQARFKAWVSETGEDRNALASFEALAEDLLVLPFPDLSAARPRGPRFGLRTWVATALGLLALGAAAAVFISAKPAGWVIDHRIVIANSAMDERFPDLSADGRLIAYMSSGPDGHLHVYLKNTTGGDAVAITHDPDWDELASAISPKADQLAFSRTRHTPEGEASTDPCLIVVKPIPDGLERIVGRCETLPFLTRLAWSHSGNALYFTDQPRSPAGAGGRIRRLDLSTGTKTDVTHPEPATAEDFNATVSPDGSKLAFVRRNGAEASFVYVMDLKSGRLTQITRGGFSAYTAWASDGRSLFVYSSQDADIWNYRADGKGVPYRLTTSGESGRITAGGGLIAFEARGRTSYIVSLKDGVQSGLTSGQRYDITPEYSADGALAFAAADGPPSLWIQRPGDQPRPLITPALTFLEDPRWSPDGRTIAFIGVERGATGIYLVNAESGVLTRLPSPDAEVGAPAWSADGRALVYPRHEAQGWRIWRREVNGGSRPEPISGYGWRHVRTWAGRLYAVREKGPGLWRLDPGGAAVQVAPEPDYDPSETEDFAHGWTIADGRLYVVDISKGVGRAAVISRPIDGGPASIVASGLDWSGGPSEDWYGGITVQPKSGAIVYARSGRRDSDIVAYRLTKK
jgi:Tol biopolymer transport system component